MNKVYRFLIISFWISILSIHAQEGSLPSLPKEPLVEKAPTFSTWTIVYTPKQNDVASVPAASIKPMRTVKEIVVLKASDTRKETRIWSDGLTSQSWIFQGYMLSDQPGSSDIYIMSPTQLKGMSSYHDYTKSDFPDLDWVSLTNFKEVTTYQGHLCYRFEKSTSTVSIPIVADPNKRVEKSSDSATVDAWIDGKTGLPLAIDDGKVVKAFSFKENSSQPLDLPPPFVEALRKYQKIKADAMGH